MPASSNKQAYKVAVLTTTRAEYSLLSPVVRELERLDGIETFFLVSGMHLEEEYGMTVSFIEKDGFKIDARIPILSNGDTAFDTSRSMANALIGFSEYFSENKPDCLVVLGDRFETLAVCCAAFNERIPIVHLHGGERTDGAADDAYRHCITKMSYLHFTATEAYRNRVIQLGEDPERVYYVGAVGVENVKNVQAITLDELSASIGYQLKKPYVLMTYHPTTLETASAEDECRELLLAMDRHPELCYLVTQANADAGGKIINRLMQDYASTHKNVCFVKSLGLVRYISAMKEAAFVMGNSSSAILEAPSFGIPTVDIGIRQKGRVASDSVIHCKAECSSILNAMDTALSENFLSIAKSSKNPYEKSGTSEAIAKTIKDSLTKGSASIKTFYDLH